MRAAVIDFGGFLGVGSRKIAVDWNALRFDRDGGKRDRVTLELTRDQVKAAPEYKDKQPVVVLGAAGGLAVAAGFGEGSRRSSLSGTPRPIERPAREDSRAPPTQTCAVARAAAGGRERTAASVAREACAVSTGSSSSSPTCRPASVRSSRSI